MAGTAGGGGRIAVLCGAHAYASAAWTDWGLAMNAAGGYGGGFAPGQSRVSLLPGFAGAGTVFVDCGRVASRLLVVGAPGSSLGTNASLVLDGNVSLAELTVRNNGNLLVSAAAGLGGPVRLQIAAAVSDGSGAPVPFGAGVSVCGWPGAPICSGSPSSSVSASRSASPSVSPTRGLSPSLSPSNAASRSASPSASPTPSQSVFPCNGQTASLQTLGGSYTWAQGQAACRGLGPGWDLPSIIDPATLALVKGTGIVAWVGVYDCCPGARRVLTTNTSYGGWLLSSGCSPAWFLANQASGAIWNPVEPNNNPNSEYCTQTIASGLINDIGCNNAYAPLVCMYLVRTVPSVTPSASPSPTLSPTTAASTSASASRSGSGSGSRSASRSASASVSRSPASASPQPLGYAYRVSGQYGANSNTGDGGPALSATVGVALVNPGQLAVDDAGARLFIPTGSAVRVVSFSSGAGGGVISRFAGSLSSSGYAGDGGPATAARLNGAGAAAWSPCSQRLYIADTGNAAVRVVAEPGGNISTLAVISSCPTGMTALALYNATATVYVSCYQTTTALYAVSQFGVVTPLTLDVAATSQAAGLAVLVSGGLGVCCVLAHDAAAAAVSWEGGGGGVGSGRGEEGSPHANLSLRVALARSLSLARSPPRPTRSLCAGAARTRCAATRCSPHSRRPAPTR